MQDTLAMRTVRAEIDTSLFPSLLLFIVICAGVVRNDQKPSILLQEVVGSCKSVKELV